MAEVSLAKLPGEEYHSLQGWGEYFSGTCLAQNDKHEYTKNIVLK